MPFPLPLNQKNSFQISSNDKFSVSIRSVLLLRWIVPYLKTMVLTLLKIKTNLSVKAMHHELTSFHKVLIFPNQWKYGPLMMAIS